MSSPVLYPDHDDRIREMWAEGLSTAEIGRRLDPPRSKNAVIGRVHRMGLPSRPPPIGLRKTVKPARKPKVTLAPSEPKPRQKPKPARHQAALVARTTTAVRMPEVHIAAARGCQYPMWSDGEKPTHLYCDTPIANGSYCEAHAAKCFRVVRDARPFVFGWGAAA